MDKEKTFEQVLEQVKTCLDTKYWDKKENGYYECELFCDYDEHLSESQLQEISEADSPREKYDEIIFEIEQDKADYEFNELWNCLESSVEDFNDYEEEIRDWLYEHVSFYLDPEHFDTEITIDIMVDYGDANYDFSEHNALNEWSNYCNELSSKSGLYWLCKQQRKVGLVKEYLKNGCDTREVITPKEAVKKMAKSCSYKIDRCCLDTKERGEHIMAHAALTEAIRMSEQDILNKNIIPFWSQKYPLKYNRIRGIDIEGDRFAETVVQELENQFNCMSVLTFCVKMSLSQYIELREAMLEEKKYAVEYEPQKSKGNGYIEISKDACVGLFNPWLGGGSVLEIELDKDVKLPVKYIWKACYDGNKLELGYSIHDVYGVSDSMWTGKVEEIKPTTKVS